MPQTYTNLRDQLAQSSPDLYSSLLRSWQIAEREWLPAVIGNKGSFNSFPHLRNLERYADDIFRQAESLDPTRIKLDMSPVEIYLLLAAILLHDIGRTIQGKWHAHASRNLIAAHFAELGIDNKNLASILADLCCYHDCTPAMDARLDLRDRSISPYGVIHCKRLAVLLKFIDNLDAAYTRVLPHYLSGNEANLIAGFRRKTTDVRVDLRHNMVVAAIRFDRWELNPSRTLYPAEVTAARAPNDVRNSAILIDDVPSPTWLEWQSIQPSPNPACTFFATPPSMTPAPDRTGFRGASVTDSRPPFSTAETEGSSYIPLPGENEYDPSSRLPYLIMRNVVFPCLDLNACVKVLDMSRVIFLVLAGNVGSNAALLKKELASPLAKYGIPVRAWLLEYDEHLFTYTGQETFEPSLSKDLLRNIVDAMCHLTGGMFGRQPCSYRTLAAKLRMGDMNVVRTAVRRIAIVVRHKKKTKAGTLQACYTVEFTPHDWRWCCGDDHPANDEGAPSVEHTQAWVLEQISGLAEPDAEL